MLLDIYIRGGDLFQSLTPSVAVMERNIKSSINPIQNRELPHALLCLLVFLVDWPVAGEIRLLCTAAVLSHLG